MPERILVPLDGSKTGESALAYLEDTLTKLKPGETPEIILLRVVKTAVHHIPVEGGTVDVSDRPKDMQPAINAAKAYLVKAGERLSGMGMKVSYEVVLGQEGISSAENIIQAEKDLNIDTVAMSTHGRRGVTRWAFGSVAEKVLRSGSVPVMLVRAK